MKRLIITGVYLFFIFNNLSAQSTATPHQAAVYPKMVGYMSFVLPVVVINRDKTTNDFESIKTFAIAFPIGLNVLYSDKFGFSYEISPTIQAGNGTTKTNKITFQPGPMFRFKDAFTIISRIAFETTGRYGVTPVFNKIFKQTKLANYFTAVSFPARFGNSQLPSIGVNVQFGLIFR